MGLQALDNLVNCRAGISPEMAICLDKAYGESAEDRLSLQTAYDIAQAQKISGFIAVHGCVPPEGVHTEP